MKTKGDVLVKQRAAPLSYRYLFLLAVIFGSSFVLISIRYGTEIRLLNREIINAALIVQEYELEIPVDGFTIKTDGCTISALNPFDENIKKFVEYPTEVRQCLYSNITLLDNNETHIWTVKDNYYYYNISDNRTLNCCYKSFYRPHLVTDITSRYVDDRVHYEECVYFSEFIEVFNEFVKVTCAYMDVEVYEQFFLFAPKKELSEESNSLNFEEFEPVKSNKFSNNYNILVMGIDAVSRMNFYRTMPKTLAYLKYKEAIELLGYNKVGDNTFPNLIPILLGIYEKDLKKTCLPNKRSTFDNCPFIWEWFKEIGYYTAFGEDSALLGTFNYFKFGFSGTPTDYYLYTFMHESEYHTGNNKDFNSFLCMGNKYYYRVLLDYIQSLTSTLKSSKLFGFFWEVTMSHDYLNYPMLMDENYENFLKKMDETGYLNNTILMLLSDHGIRWGEIRKTKQGRLEERLPFVYILIPPDFRVNYETAYNNIKANSKRLTTPFDLHETLMHLVNVSTLTDEEISRKVKKSYAKNRSISLFLPIPSNRTCKTAGIEEHWCTCHKGKKLKPNHKDVTEASNHLMRHLNFLIRARPQCARLKTTEIIDATEMEVIGTKNVEVNWREITLVVRAAPSGAIFEATLRRYNNWEVSGSVSRLNLYGDQSRCVDDYRLKLYCYCD